MLLHGMVFAFGFVHFTLKDNLNTSREQFGLTFIIARAAALVLHVDVALILLRECREIPT